MSKSYFSNIYQIKAHRITSLSNERVFNISRHTKKWPSFFYLNIEFQDKQHFEKFQNIIVPELKKAQYIKKEIFYNTNHNILSIPLPYKFGRGYKAVQVTKTNALINFLSEKCAYDFNKNLTKSMFERRDPIKWNALIGQGVGYLVAGTAIAVLSAYSLLSFFLFTLSGVVGMSLLGGRDMFKTYCNEEYLSKDPKALEDLSESHKASFNLGVQAAGSFLVQFKSCFNSDSLKHPKAYYAGMIAKEVDSPLEKDLIESLKPKL